MKPSGILNFENVPQDAGDPDVKVYVNGELVETGGGGGDFTTAIVSVSEDVNVIATYLLTNGDDTSLWTDSGMYADMSPFIIPLYKGKIIMVPSGGNVVSVTANNDNAKAEDGKLVITGDCEITSVTYDGGGN